MLNYNQIIELNREFAAAHKILKNFGNGQRWKIVEHNQQATFKYPLMWMEDLPHPSTSGVYTFAFRVYFLDQVANLKERGTDSMTVNDNVVKSDMIQCAQDLISFWAQDHDYPFLDVDKNIQLTPIEDQLEDVVTGGYFDLKITQAFVYNKCAIPMSGVTSPDSDEVSIIGNSVLMSTVLCGQTYSFSIVDQDGAQAGTFDSLTKTWTVDSGGDVTSTFNGDPVTPTPAGGTKAVRFKNSAGTDLGDVIVDDANNLNVVAVDITKTDSDGTVTSVPAGVNVVCAPCVSPVETIGTIFDVHANELLNLNDFTINIDGATSITLDQGYIKITGSPAVSLFPLDNYIQYNGWITSLETWTFTLDVIIKSYTNADQGVIAGWMGDSSIPAANKRSDWYVHYRNSSSAATGDGYRYFNGTTTLTPNTFNTNPLTAEVTPVVDNHFRFTIVRSMTTTGARFTLTIRNMTTGLENSGSLDYSYQNTTGQLDMNSSKFFIGTTGGTHWITRMKLTSSEIKNPNWVWRGDSLTAGYNATLRANHWTELVRAANPSLTFTKLACQGDRALTASNAIAELQLLDVTKAGVWIGTNDGVASSGTAIANYDAMITAMISAGITEFVHTTPLPRLGLAIMLTLRNHIIATYGSLAGHTVIDIYTYADDPSNPGHLNPVYTSDNVHGNDLLWTWYSGQWNTYLA